MEKYIKCPSCKVNIPKQDLEQQTGDKICIICKKSFPSDAPSNEPAPAAPKMTTKRRWVELKSKRGKTYYHNNETGEDRWDIPSDFEVVSTVPAHTENTPPPMINFKADDPVRNAILLQQNKQEARKQGLPEDVIETLAAKQAAQQEGNSLRQAMSAMEQQRAKQKASIPVPPSSPKNSSGSNAEPKGDSPGESSSCLLM